MYIRSLVNASLVVMATLHPGYSQTVSPGGIVNAASFQAAVAPGSVVSIFGTNLASGTVSASSVPLPTVLGGTSVLVNGKPVPLFYVSPSQINVQLPYELEPGSATLAAMVNGSSSSPVAFPVAASAPGIVVYPNGRAVALNQDGALNGPDKAAMPGTVVTLYMVGQGAVTTPVPTGAASPADPVVHASLPITVTVGGRPVEVLFAGLSPGGVGLFQINWRVPNLGGDCPLLVTVGGVPSNSATITLGWTVMPGPVE